MDATPTSRLTGEQALQESEFRLQQVLDNASALVFAKDLSGRYLFVNREFEVLSARSAAEIIGRTDDELFPPDLAARFRHNDLRVLRERRAIEVEETADFGHGRRTYVAAKFPLLDSHGHAYAVCGIATDISDRKRLEDAWSSAALAVSQSSEETLYQQLVRFLATILEVDGAFVARWDADAPDHYDMVAFYLDGEVRENFRYGSAGTPCQTVIGQCFRLYGSKVTERFPTDSDFGRLGFESYAGHPLFDTQGRAVGLISVVSRKPLEQEAFIESVLRIFSVRVNAEMDRVAAQQALQTSEASYREIFEASDDAIFVHDWDTGAIVDVNPRACETYGYSRAELLSGAVGQLSDGEPPYALEDALRWLERARSEGAARFEWPRRRKDGSLHWDEVRLKSATIGGKRRVLAITRDITERREAERRREELESRLRQAQKMQALGQLTGGIAHDFNNLLTTITGYVVLAADRDSAAADPRLGGYLDHARRACERARDLIQQMLMFSRGQRSSPQVVSLGRLLAEAAPRVAAQLPAAMRLELDTGDAEATTVRLDPLQAEQVLLNLCVNARDAMGEQGVLSVSVSEGSDVHGTCAGCRTEVAGQYVQLAVRDTGPGIPVELRDRIFEPFFTTKEAGKGTGMGLAIVHGLVHEHGGHVLLESSSSGTLFRVVWPAASPLDVAAAPQAEVTERAGRVRPKLHGRVLIVDDERAVGEFMRELLETWGLTASYVTHAETALARINADPDGTDVVITDQSMPGMTGLELVERLHAVHSDLPVVLYTGLQEALPRPSDPARAPRAILRKPVDPQALATVLGSILSLH